MGRSQLKVEFIDKLGEDLDIVNAAKVSYGREAATLDSQALGTMTHMADNDHGSPFEMVVMKVRVTCPLFVGVQWIRHRIGSINMESSRYMDREMVEVYLPDTEDIKGQDPNNKQGSSIVLPLEDALAVLESMKESEEAMRRNYHNINKVRHASKEIARFVTTQNIMVQFIYMTNLRAWANFCLLRNDLHAQFEIRYLARQVERLLKQYFPNATRLLIKEQRKRRHIVYSVVADIKALKKAGVDPYSTECGIFGRIMSTTRELGWSSARVNMLMAWIDREKELMAAPEAKEWEWYL